MMKLIKTGLFFVAILILSVFISGCTDLDTNLNKQPISSFTMSINEEIDYTIVDFHSTSHDDGHITQHIWNFQDGTITTIPNPTHIYKKNGNYSITLKVIDDSGNWNISKTNLIITNISNNTSNYNIKINDHNAYTSSINYSFIFGTVSNNDSSTLENVTLNAKLYDNEYEVIEQQMIILKDHIINPGDYSTFKFFFEGVTNFSYYSIEIINVNKTNKLTTDDLQILNHSLLKTENGIYYINGTVSNLGNKSFNSIAIYSLLYDKNKNLIGLTQTRVNKDLEILELKPFESDAFTIVIFNFDIIPDSIIYSYDLEIISKSL